VANLQLFQFGAQNPTTTYRGEPALVGDFGLHIQCPWRIVGLAGIVVGASDLYYPAGDDPYNEPQGWHWDRSGASRRDQKIHALFAGRRDDPFTVLEATATDAFGGITIVLREGYRLELFPADSLPDEHWRLLTNITPHRPHFVVTGAGIDIVSDLDEAESDSDE
jgi:hypothetical protein